jgi:hypothetical protein
MSIIGEGVYDEGRAEIWEPESIRVEILGSPSPEVVSGAKHGVAGELNELSFRGEAPPVVVSDGKIVSGTTGEPFISCYDWEASPPTIRLSQMGFKRLWEEVGVAVSDEISAIFAAAHETTHYVRDCEGRLPHQGNKETIDRPAAHYANPNEEEAEDIAISVTNKVLGYTYISRN